METKHRLINWPVDWEITALVSLCCCCTCLCSFCVGWLAIIHEHPAHGHRISHDSIFAVKSNLIEWKCFSGKNQHQVIFNKSKIMKLAEIYKVRYICKQQERDGNSIRMSISMRIAVDRNVSGVLLMTLLGFLINYVLITFSRRPSFALMGWISNILYRRLGVS